MAPPSSDMKPPSPKEYGDNSLGLQQEHPQTAASDSPAKMSPARDTSDGACATPKKDLTHADQQLSKAKMAPTLETSDDIASITDEKNLPMSTPVSSKDHTRFFNKATDCTTSDTTSPHSEALASSANELGSLANSAGTGLSSDEHSQGRKSISSGKTSLNSAKARDLGSSGGYHLGGSTAFSLAKNMQDDGKVSAISNPGSRKRKNPQPSIGEKMAESQHEQPRGKKLRSSTTSVIAAATENAKFDPETGASKVHESPISSQQSKRKSRPDRSGNTEKSSTTRKEVKKARAAVPQAQTQQPLLASVPPIDRKINALQTVVGLNGQSIPCREAAPLPNDRQLRLSAYDVDLDPSAMEPFMFNGVFQTTGGYKRNQLFRSIVIVLFTSNECAPVLRQWKLECYDDPNMEAHLPFALLGSDSAAWAKEMHQLASCAMHYAAIVKKTMTFKSDHRQAIMSCAKFVRRLVHCNSPYIMHYLNMCNFPDTSRFLFQFYAGMLSTAYENLVNHPGSFFEILLNSPFATGITSEARPSWLHLLGLPYADQDPRHRNPVEDVQKAALAYGATTLKKLPVSSKKLIRVTETYYDSGKRLKRTHSAFQEEASHYSHLLTSTNNQKATSAPLRKTPSLIENHKNLCTMPSCKNNHDRTPVLQDDESAETVPDPDERAPLRKLGPGYEAFALSKGRIIPCRALVAEDGDPDPFTKQEELILYKRFKAVITASPPGHQDVARLSSEKWWEFWAKIAEALPGRGVMGCIAFYVANKEHFQHR
jgi:hypothetical protein